MSSKRYRIAFARQAEKDFKALPAAVRTAAARKINALAGNPRPHGAEKLAGEADLYRIRAGDYRIIYAIRDAELLVLVVRARHRREVYR